MCTAVEVTYKEHTVSFWQCRGLLIHQSPKRLAFAIPKIGLVGSILIAAYNVQGTISKKDPEVANASRQHGCKSDLCCCAYIGADEKKQSI